MDLKVYHDSDGGVQFFSFQNIEKKDYLIKSLKLFERVSSPFINCSAGETAVPAPKLPVNDGNRASKKVEHDMTTEPANTRATSK